MAVNPTPGLAEGCDTANATPSIRRVSMSAGKGAALPFPRQPQPDPWPLWMRLRNEPAVRLSRESVQSFAASLAGEPVYKIHGFRQMMVTVVGS